MFAENVYMHSVDYGVHNGDTSTEKKAILKCAALFWASALAIWMPAYYSAR